jgi:hypothetical protein
MEIFGICIVRKSSSISTDYGGLGNLDRFRAINWIDFFLLESFSLYIYSEKLKIYWTTDRANNSYSRYILGKRYLQSNKFPKNTKKFHWHNFDTIIVCFYFTYLTLYIKLMFELLIKRSGIISLSSWELMPRVD